MDITGVVWNSVTVQSGSPSSGTLGPGQGACRPMEVRPLPCPYTTALGGGSAFPGPGREAPARPAHLWVACWTGL